jgi:hypothetical protein
MFSWSTFSGLRTVKTTVLGLTGVALLSVSCGKNPEQVQVVKNLELTATTNEAQEVILSFGAELDLGNMSLPALELPVNHPETQENLGALALIPTFEGTNEISIEVNLTNATSDVVNSTGAVLPNGRDIPVGGIDNSKVIAFPVAQTGIKIYLGLSTGMALFGVAVPIVQLDTVGKSIGGVNIFPTFNIKGVKGIAGLFTGTKKAQSGLALFVDLSKVVDPTKIIKEKDGAISIAAQSALRQTTAVKNKVFFYPSSGSAEQMEIVGERLYELHERKAKLKVR